MKHVKINADIDGYRVRIVNDAGERLAPMDLDGWKGAWDTATQLALCMDCDLHIGRGALGKRSEESPYDL